MSVVTAKRTAKRPASPLKTFPEAMEYLRVSRSTLYRLLWSNQLAGHKVGHNWRFYVDDLDACIREVQQ
jgi:excisionase family DNA binding protein